MQLIQIQNYQSSNITTLLATSSADGSTPVVVKADPSTHALEVSDGTTGSDLSGDNASRDQNQVPVFMGVSSTDGKTSVPIYVNQSTGELLIKST